MSGKTARRLRKKHIFSKKALAVCAGLCLSSLPVAAGGEFLISLYPQFTKPFGESHSIQYGIGGGARLTYRPIKFLNVFAQGDYLSMALPGVDPISIIQGEAGTGYHLDVTDRISFDLNVNIGAYNAKATSSSVSGISAGGSLTFSYKFTPAISADVSASATHFAGKPTPLMMVNAGLAPGVTINITQLFNNKTKLAMEVNELAPVFPVLYSWYENNTFGQVEIINNEETDISDITVSFYQPQYMTHAKECATIRKIEQGKSAKVDLVAFFNEQMLELTEKADTNSYVIVNYARLGKKASQTFAFDLPVYGRNNMSWDDDRRAAVFVSSKDPAAMQFGKYTASIVRENLRVDVPINIQYALGIFEALNQFGINYVVDPSSAFEDNVGTSSIDFLQFPYQTLMFRGGDCDDLSILVCSLFEAVGVDTAFITIPGHIFMAFNAGITPEMAKTTFRNTSDFIFIDDEVWVPLEITLSDEGFYKAARYGAREWNTAAAQGTAALYKMSDSWKLYQPISVPGATAYFNMPESNAIYLAFANGIDQWSRGELKSYIASDAVHIAMLNTEEEEKNSDLIIKGNPLSTKTLNDIISLSGTAALPPVAIREEELEDDYEEEEDELLEDVLPLEFALATLQTDTSVVEPAATASEEEDDNQDQPTGRPDWAQSSSLDWSQTEIGQAMLEAEGGTEEELEEEEEDPFAEIQAIAAAFIEDNPVIHVEKSEPPAEAPAAEPVETQVAEPAETQEIKPEETPLVEKETPVVEPVENTSSEPEESSLSSSDTPSSTRNIILITSISAAAVLAAGIIIFGKKKKREGEK